MSDLISRQAAIDVLDAYQVMVENGEKNPYAWAGLRMRELPSAQPDGWLEQNKDKILQAGMEGREIDFRIGGRLFAIREKAQ